MRRLLFQLSASLSLDSICVCLLFYLCLEVCLSVLCFIRSGVYLPAFAFHCLWTMFALCSVWLSLDFMGLSFFQSFEALFVLLSKAWECGSMWLAHCLEEWLRCLAVSVRAFLYTADPSPNSSTFLRQSWLSFLPDLLRHATWELWDSNLMHVVGTWSQKANQAIQWQLYPIWGKGICPRNLGSQQKEPEEERNN